MIGRCLVLLLAVCLPASARAADEADAILRDLGLQPASQVVRVDAVREVDGQIRVTLTALDGVHLVADPGVSVVPVDRSGLPAAEPTALKDSGHEYFDWPPVLQVDAGAATGLRVEYAYCVVAKQCLFGDVTVPVPN